MCRHTIVTWHTLRSILLLNYCNNNYNYNASIAIKPVSHFQGFPQFFLRCCSTKEHQMVLLVYKWGAVHCKIKLLILFYFFDCVSNHTFSRVIRFFPIYIIMATSQTIIFNGLHIRLYIHSVDSHCGRTRKM